MIDRDGILESKMADAVENATEPGARVLPAMPVSLPGASGYRADIEVVRPMGTARPPLPYVYIFAMASTTAPSGCRSSWAATSPS